MLSSKRLGHLSPLGEYSTVVVPIEETQDLLLGSNVLAYGHTEVQGRIVHDVTGRSGYYRRALRVSPTQPRPCPDVRKTLQERLGDAWYSAGSGKDATGVPLNTHDEVFDKSSTLRSVDILYCFSEFRRPVAI